MLDPSAPPFEYSAPFPPPAVNFSYIPRFYQTQYLLPHPLMNVHGHFSPYLSTYFVDYASPHHSVFATRALFHGTITEAPPRNPHVEEEAVAKAPSANNPLPTPNPTPPPPQPPPSIIAAATTCDPDPLHEWQRKPIRKGLVWMRRSDAVKREKGREEEEEEEEDDEEEGAQFTRPCVFLSFPKSSSARRGGTSSDAALEFDESNRKSEKRTTVMIKNIPNKFSRKMLIEMLDDHCRQESAKESLKKAKGNGDPMISVLCAYDFVYLPMDFRNRCNKGYAFVNFTTAEAARRLYERVKGCKWEVFDSKKILHVCFARIQGKIALMENFSNSYFWCDTDDYLPAVFSPPRNGCSTSLSPPAIIGRRAASLSPCH